MCYAPLLLRPKIKDISLGSDLMYYKVRIQSCNKTQILERLGRTSIKVILLLTVVLLPVTTDQDCDLELSRQSEYFNLTK